VEDHLKEVENLGSKDVYSSQEELLLIWCLKILDLIHQVMSLEWFHLVLIH